jgi:atrial natriuretic peptide receptor A
MYAWAFNKTLADGDDPADGRVLSRKVWNQTFYNGKNANLKSDLRFEKIFIYTINLLPQFDEVGLTGDIAINENGDREADYTLSDLDPENGIMRPVATYYGAKRLYSKMINAEIHWPGVNNAPPPDVPFCGFTGDAVHCLIKGLIQITFYYNSQ